MNVNPDRDYHVDMVADIASAEAGYPCPTCGEAMVEEKAIEIGNIFKLGTLYSSALGATFLDPNRERRHRSSWVAMVLGAVVRRRH